MSVHYTYWGEHFGYKFSLLPEVANALPQWHKDEAFPPLSPRVAIANSRSVVKRILTELEPFEPSFSECSLKATSEYEGGWWYYVVSWFVPDPEDIAADWSGISVPVLFDGSTPDPVKFRYEDRFQH